MNKDRHRGAECKQMLNRLAQLENNGGLLMFHIIGSFSVVSVADAMWNTLQLLWLSRITAIYWLMVLAPPIEAHVTCTSKGHTRDITPQISFLQEEVDLTCVVSRYLPILTLDNNFQTTFFERFVTNDDTYDVCVKYLLKQHSSDCQLTFFLRKEVHSVTSAQCILLGSTNYTTRLNQFWHDSSRFNRVFSTTVVQY